MNEDKEDQLDPQAPGRREMQPPIPTRPPNPAEAGETDKVVAPAKPPGDPNAPPHANTAIGSGPLYDEVGGPGLGQAPGEGDAAGTRDRDTRAVDQQDQTDKK